MPEGGNERMKQYDITNHVTVEEYQEFRRAVGWSLFGDEQAESGLKHSYYVVCIRSEGKAIAMARVIWDHGYILFIADVMVLPEYQGQGLGRGMIEHILNHIKTSTPSGYKIWVTLLSAKGKEAFYEKFGFIQRPNEMYGPGMHLWVEV